MMENAVRPVNPTDVMAAGFAYQVGGPERDKLYGDAVYVKQQRLIDGVEGGLLFDAAPDCIELEFEASLLRIFAFDLLPGLLQIPECTRATIRADDLDRAEVILVRQEMSRAERQARLRVKDPLRVQAVFNEAIIRTVVGGPSVMRAQQLHLMALVELSNVDIRIMPFSQGAFPGMGSTFTLMSFPHEQHVDVVYVENFMQGQYMERPIDRELCNLGFEGVWRLAMSPEEALELIAEAAESL